jgi:virginiamycin B lyase
MLVVLAASSAWGLAQGASSSRPAPRPIQLTFDEWSVNAPGMVEPHDPTVDPQGNAWYTGYSVNTLGYVNPRTGQVKEYPLATPNIGPHGLVPDATGAIWFTGNRSAMVGRLDPKTGNVTAFPMPDPAAKDPHTPILDTRGNLWFTCISDYVGKLDTSTGKVTLKAIGQPKSSPHGIVVNSKGVPFFTLSGTNKIASIVNPQTLDLREYVLPEGARPRRIGTTADDVVWYTDLAKGVLGRLDPNSGLVREFQGPSGPKAGPWSLAVTPDGMVWFTESAVDPNTLTRFDPKTETMQTWPMPSKGGLVRHMVSTADGALWLASSGNAKMVRARVK